MTSALAASAGVRAIGVALIWFVLQGALVATVVAALFVLARRASANLRYLIGCAGLAAMAAMPVVTAIHVWTPAAVVAADSVVASSSESLRVAPHVLVPPDASWRTRLTPARIAPLVVLAWITGVLALTVRLLGGWLQVVRIRRSARVTAASDGVDWPERIARLAHALGIDRGVQLLESALVGVPVVIGWLRPVILLPVGVFAGLSSEQVDAILAHELAHIRRGDYVVNALQRVVEIVLFYHPAVWWVSASIRRERELCCDDLAAPLSPSPLTYAHALIALEERRGRAPSLAMAATRGGLFARIRRIVDPTSAIDSTVSKGTVMTIVSSVIALALTGAMSVGHAAPAPTAQTPTEVQTAARREAAPAESSVRTVTRIVQRIGSIRGIVSDQRNARIPGATITLDTIGREGQSRTVRSDGLGQFTVEGLTEGAYLLTVKLSGFRADERRVEVSGGVDLIQNVQLKLGAVEDTRTVVASKDALPASETAPKPQQASTASVAGLLETAKQATDAGQLAAAEASIREALAIIHASLPRPQVPGPTGAVRVGGDIKEPKKIRDVPPIYPAAARAAGIQGVVIIEATIDVNGDVTDALVIRGVPELNDAALDAVRQWGYTPTLLSGQPVSVLMTVTVVFSMK